VVGSADEAQDGALARRQESTALLHPLKGVEPARDMRSEAN
jgi:hypothetical protein